MKSPFPHWGRRSRRAATGSGSTAKTPALRRNRRRRGLFLERLEDRELLTVTVGFNTNVGSFHVDLLDDAAPQTVQNFLSYVAYGSFNGTIFHRSVPGFIVQGGGFNIDGAIATDAPVQNEFSPSRSNVRGTIAMAKLGGNPNSATNQWFFNLANNSGNLDNQNGGFTVFGNVVGTGMTVVDAIAGVPKFNKSNGNGLPAGLASASVRGALTDIPLLNYDNNPTTDPVSASNLVTVTSVQVISATGNIPPILHRLTNSVFAAGASISTNIQATDFDIALGRNETLTYSLDAGAPVGASITPAGLFTWTPSQAQYGQRHSITFRVTDAAGRTDSQAVSFDISAPPVVALNLALNIDQNATATISNNLLSVTDADTPAAQVVYSVTQSPTKGSLRRDGVSTTSFTQEDVNQGRISYVSSGPTGADQFVATVSDGNAVSSIGLTFSINVQALNAAPSVAVNAGLSLAKGAIGAIGSTQLSSTDTDNTAAQITYTVTAAPGRGSLLLSGVATTTFTQDDVNQGRITYSHNNGGETTDIFSFSITDGFHPASAPQTFSLRINQPPSLSPIGNRNVNEQTLLDFSLAVADVNGDTLSVSMDAGAPAGATFDPVARRFQWTPTEAQGPGSYPITFSVQDNGSPELTVTETIIVNVADVNLAPVMAPIGNRSTLQGGTVSFQVSASDTDLPVQLVTLLMDSGAPQGSTFDPATGVFTWNVPANQPLGDYTVTFRARDNASPAGESTQAVIISVKRENLAPTLAAIGNKNIDEGTALQFTASASDGNDPADVLTYTLVNAPAGAGINPVTGAFSWTPTEVQGNAGTFTFIVRVTDNGAPSLSDDESITVTVNKTNMAPVLATIGDQQVNEGSLLLFTATGFDDDLPDQTLTFSMDAGAPAGATFDSLTRVFRWTPTEAQGPGAYSVTIRVADGQGGSDSETFTISVGETDSAPIINDVPLQLATEGQAINFQVTATDADLPAQTLTFSLAASSAPAGAAITPQGAFSWTPSEAQGPGDVIVQILVTDSTGLSDTRSVRIRVAESNQAPVLNAIGDKSINEAALLDFTATATDPDLPANALTFSLGPGAPAGAAISPQGRFTWTPSASQSGQTFPITIRVADGGSLSHSETIQVTINDVNQPPVLSTIGPKVILEGNVLTYAVGATDADLPANTLTFSMDAGAPDGATFDPVFRQFRWQPTEGQGPGLFPVTIRVSDGQGGTDSETFEIAVTEVNVAPIIVPFDASFSIEEGQTLNFLISAIDNDVPNNQLLLNLAAGAPLGATLTGVGSDAQFRFTPDESLGGGTYQIVVQVTDSTGLTTDRAFSVVVTETSVAPQLAPLFPRSVVQGQPLTVAASASDADAPAQVLTYSLVGEVPAGAAIDPLTGIVRWTVPSDQSPGDYTLNVRVTDPTGLSADQPLQVSVLEGPDLALLSLLMTPREADACRNLGVVSLNNAAGPALAGAAGAFPLASFAPPTIDAAANDRALAELAAAAADSTVGPDTGVAHIVRPDKKAKDAEKKDEPKPDQKFEAPAPNDEESSTQRNEDAQQASETQAEDTDRLAAIDQALEMAPLPPAASELDSAELPSTAETDAPLRTEALHEAARQTPASEAVDGAVQEALAELAAAADLPATDVGQSRTVAGAPAGLPWLALGASLQARSRHKAHRRGRLGNGFERRR